MLPTQAEYHRKTDQAYDPFHATDEYFYCERVFLFA